MNKNTQLVIGLEILFWLATAAIVYLVMRPIWNNLTAFQFETENIVAIALFVTYTRYIFLLKHTFFARTIWIKLLFMLVAIPLTFYLVGNLNAFQTHLDEYGPDTFMKYLLPDLTIEEETGLMSYIKNQFSFFAVGSVIVSVIMPFRMLISIWRVRNRGTV